MKYELSAYELSLIAGGFTVVGALISGLVSYWLAKLLADRSARIAAASNLRAAFATHLFNLRLESSRTAGILLKSLIDDFPTHGSEMGRFRFFVHCKRRAAYDDVCQQYADLVRTHQSATHPDTPTSVFRERICAILMFAKP